VFNTIFYNISVISWWPVLLVEETRVPLTCHKFWIYDTSMYRYC